MMRSNIQTPFDENESNYDDGGNDESYHGGQLIAEEDFDEDGDLSHSQRTKIDELLGAWYGHCCFLGSPRLADFRSPIAYSLTSSVAQRRTGR